MTAEAVTSAGRSAAEALMTDSCVIRRASTAVPVFNSATGISETSAPSTVYTGPCRVRMLSLTDRAAGAGEHDFTVQEFVLSLPAAATSVRVDDEVEITGSRLDPALPSRRFVVGPVAHGSQLTARRFLAREVTS